MRLAERWRQLQVAADTRELPPCVAESFSARPYPALVSFLCPYCGELKEDDRRTVEHPVPARIGGNLEIETCDECNEGAARVIDNPVLFRDGDVRALRATYDVRSPRRRGRPSRDEFIGQFSGQDAKAAWRPSPAGGEVVQLTAADPFWRKTAPSRSLRPRTKLRSTLSVRSRNFEPHIRGKQSSC